MITFRRKLPVACLCFLVLMGVAGAQSPLLKEKYRFELSDPTDRVLIAKFNYDASKILLVGKKATQVWSIETGKLLCDFSQPISLLKDGIDVVWQPGGNRILQYNSQSYSKKAVAIVWDSETGRRIETLSESGGVDSAMWNSNGTRILTVGVPPFMGQDATFSVRDEDGKLVRTQKFGSFDIHSVTFSNRANKLIVSYHARQGHKPVRIYDADSGRLEASYEHGLVNVNPLTHAIFAGESPDGEYLCGQIDTSKGVTCWKSNDETKPIYSFLDTKETGDTIFLSFSDDSKSLAIAKLRQRLIEIIDAATGRTLSSIQFRNDLRRLVNGKIMNEPFQFGDLWSKDRKYFVATDVEREVKIWNVISNRQVLGRPAIWDSDYDWFVGTLPADFEVFSFNSRNDLLLCVSNEIVQIVEPSSGKILYELKDGGAKTKNEETVHQRNVSSWSPDGSYLLTAAEKNRAVVVWTVNY